MKKLSALFIACMLLILACKNESNPETFARINAEVLQNSKAYATLGEATSTIGHRLTGSENGKKAEEYTYNKFKEYGFDVEFQEFETNAWSRGSIGVIVDGDTIKAVTLGHAPVNADVTGELVDMGNGLEADYAAKPGAAKDKLVLIYIGILEGSPEGTRNLHRSEKTAIAIKNGAKGVVIFNQVDKGVLLTGTASVTGKLIPIPAICIAKEKGFELKEKLKAGGKIQAHITMTNHSDPIKARNVIATLRGSEFTNEKIIIGGHLDSWDLATGAIDNGIGSFAILDIARAFKANNLKPKRTIQFVMFMGEEQGLLGSTYMVDQAVKDGSIENIKYMFNIDMGGNPIGVNAGGKLNDTTFFKTVGVDIMEIDTIYKNKFSNRSGLHSDHQPFMLEGVPILSITSNLDRSIYGCYHSDCDDFNLVNETHIRNTARFGTMILYALANADKLPADKMDSETTKQFMIDNNLEEPLRIAGEWKWD
jgi:Iap family predicted aminopeptidase